MEFPDISIAIFLFANWILIAFLLLRLPDISSNFSICYWILIAFLFNITLLAISILPGGISWHGLLELSCYQSCVFYAYCIFVFLILFTLMRNPLGPPTCYPCVWDSDQHCERFVRNNIFRLIDWGRIQLKYEKNTV